MLADAFSQKAPTTRHQLSGNISCLVVSGQSGQKNFLATLCVVCSGVCRAVNLDAFAGGLSSSTSPHLPNLFCAHVQWTQQVVPKPGQYERGWSGGLLNFLLGWGGGAYMRACVRLCVRQRRAFDSAMLFLAGEGGDREQTC